MVCPATGAVPDASVIIKNDTLCEAITRAQIPAVKQPTRLLQQDGKRSDGTALLPWARGKPMAWDVTVPDNYAESQISHTAKKAGAAANKAFGERDSQIRSSVCLT